MAISSSSISPAAKPDIAFPKNAWYVAAYPEDIGAALFARTILGEHLAFYRKKDEKLVALRDRCPHRLAPLSRGRLIDDCVECPYHGLRFSSNGQCTFNPHHPGTIPVKMAVPAHAREVNGVPERTDSYRDSVWIAPCIVRNELVQVPAGTPRDAGRLRYNTHICTPETHRSMHDFALRSRNFSLSDREIDRRLLEGQKPVVVDEDGAMLKIIQERMGDAPFESFNPVMFHIDTGAVRVRRILERMVAAESGR